MNLYPRSLLRLVLLGWLLMALPLLFAIAYASLSLARLSERSDIAMQQVSQASRLGWDLEGDLAQMERILRQQEVLQDATLWDDYAIARRAWLKTAKTFAQLPLLAPLADRINAMRMEEADAARKLPDNPHDLKALRNIVGELRSTTFELIEEIGHLAETERQALKAETDALQNRLLIAITLAFTLAGAMFWFGRRLLDRLLKSIERALILLGNNLFDRRIRLKGPDDVRWIGKRLDWLRRRLRALEEERTRILRHISHELKTPLAALREGASLLNEGVAGPLSPKQAKIAGIMHGNTLRLQGLIDGLLKLQQAEHARDWLRSEDVRIDELIQHALETHKLATRDKRLRITGTLAPLVVHGGREELTALVHNLLSNAIKFSPENGTVRVLLTSENGQASLDVIDEGPGVPEDDRNRIFEPFYRGPNTKSVAGVGLGLAIAHGFAAAHRGSLNLLPSAAGAHFRAQLPLAGSAA